jgi:ABC-type polysaccharide/polyol phosphate transport system ATPase subunit
VEGCDTLVWLDKGRVRRMGTVEEVLPEYMVELERAESASMAGRL